MAATNSAAHRAGMVIVGEVAGVYGVRGWLRVLSYTRPETNILSYCPWYLLDQGQWTPWTVTEGRGHGAKGVVAHLESCDDRDTARQHIGAAIGVHRDQLPAVSEGEYYWVDLIGLAVVNLAGVALGRIEDLVETGANDVLVVRNQRERLIPYIGDVVREIDLERGVMRVDWDPEF